MIIFSLLIGSYFVFASVYMLFFAIAAKLPSRRYNQITDKTHSIAVLIPAYKEDKVILDVARQAAQHNYENFNVYIIADSLQPKTLDKLNEFDVTTIVVDFEKSTKAKSLTFAFDQIDLHDIALVLDADNIMEDGFLKKINKSFNEGHRVVQGKRIAKNTASSFSYLDSLSEQINNSIYNKGQINLGLSSRIVGSAMAFEFDLYKRLIQTRDDGFAEDKLVEILLLKENIYIHYLSDAVVLDEKVNNAAVFSAQRTRWITAQFYYLRKYTSTAWFEFFKRGNIELLNKMAQLSLPPRLSIPVILLAGSILHLFLDESLFVFWTTGFLINVIANSLAIPKQMYNKKMVAAFFALPKAIYALFRVLLNMNHGKKEFIHTPHG